MTGCWLTSTFSNILCLIYLTSHSSHFCKFQSCWNLAFLYGFWDFDWSWPCGRATRRVCRCRLWRILHFWNAKAATSNWVENNSSILAQHLANSLAFFFFESPHPHLEYLRLRKNLHFYNLRQQVLAPLFFALFSISNTQAFQAPLIIFPLPDFWWFGRPFVHHDILKEY